MKQFSEATRVQMPAMVHLTRLGYTYFGKIYEDMSGTVYDGDTNILLPVFEEQFKKLNPSHEGEFLQVLIDKHAENDYSLAKVDNDNFIIEANNVIIPKSEKDEETGLYF